MTKEVIFYRNRKLMKKGKKGRHLSGFSVLHTDFVNNDESQGYQVTFVNGIDDPDNSDEAKQQRATHQLLKLLKAKLVNDRLTFKESKMLMRIERNLPLLQTTIDKIRIAFQGGMNGIIQRIKNLFNL